MQTGAQAQPRADSTQLVATHLEMVRQFYATHLLEHDAPGRCYRELLARFYRYLIPPTASILEIGCGNGELLSRLPNRDIMGVDLAEEQVAVARKRLPHGIFLVSAGEFLSVPRKFDFIIISDTVNEAADVQAILEKARNCAHPHTRLIVNYFNNLWRPAIGLAAFCGWRVARPTMNWLSHVDIRNLLHLAGWETINEQYRTLLPFCLPGLDALFNRFLAPLPLLRIFCLSVFSLARPLPEIQARRERTVSVIVPARNEAGNLHDAVRRTPEMGTHTELIFIEGNSTDNTWEVIQQLPAAYPDRDIKVMQQTGKGKGNAVREAFAVATGDILMILDADLTMPPEDLPKYYEALVSGRAEFVNGVRLVYPMEDQAMRFLNMCANHAFSMIFSYLLSQPVRDTLCGTKVLFRKDYERISANRSYFGDFDPFGDFDLLFGAAKLNLRIADIPIRYRNRTYGETNISRWKHGLLLLRMVIFASGKMKFI